VRLAAFLASLRGVPKDEVRAQITGWKRAEELWPQPMTAEEKIALARFEERELK